MITYELLTKLRLENTSLLARLDQLEARAANEASASLAHEIGMMQNDLRDYVGLVDAVLDALMPDAPRPKRSASRQVP